MDHVVYLDHKSQELENLAKGQKDMIVRGAMGRKMPHGRAKPGDTLYFIRNNGEGLVKAMAKIKHVFHSEKLSPEDSQELFRQHEQRLMLDARMTKRFSGKRYLVLIEVSEFEDIQPFEIDRSKYGNMDDWLLIEDIKNIMREA